MHETSNLVPEDQLSSLPTPEEIAANAPRDDYGNIPGTSGPMPFHIEAAYKGPARHKVAQEYLTDPTAKPGLEHQFSSNEHAEASDRRHIEDARQHVAENLPSYVALALEQKAREEAAASRQKDDDQFPKVSPSYGMPTAENPSGVTGVYLEHADGTSEVVKNKAE